jgi:dTDP-4-dehydrorhamnose 3,5-epimerase
MGDWLLEGARRDAQSVTADWTPVGDELIDGVRVHEARNVIRGTGRLTEVWRSDWELDDLGVDQVFQNEIQPGGVSAWHAHEHTTDRLAIVAGQLTVVLYDGRVESPTHRRINELHLSASRPMIVVVPPKVWHGVTNRAASAAALLNLVDRAYDYEQPDHWRVPADTDEIPYRIS